MADSGEVTGTGAGSEGGTGSRTVKATFGLDENVASALCYLLGWVTGIIFLLVENENKTVRFHAMQSVITFLPLNILAWIFTVFGFFFWIFAMLIWILMFILWLVLMYKAYIGEKFMVPIAGEIAANQLK